MKPTTLENKKEKKWNQYKALEKLNKTKGLDWPQTLEFGRIKSWLKKYGLL